ncbi:MAG: Fur family transcriptional regulator [Candidatus Sericytochromatia bacterium]
MSEHIHNHQAALEDALKRLKRAGLKQTRSRQALLEVLVHHHGPFSIEELQQRMEVDCDIATIYRNMALLESMHLVENCDFGDGLARYEWAGSGHEHHHHIICRVCHQAEQLEYCFVMELEKLVRQRGYTDVSHRLEFYGVCARCQAKQAENVSQA